MDSKRGHTGLGPCPSETEKGGVRKTGVQGGGWGASAWASWGERRLVHPFSSVFWVSSGLRSDWRSLRTPRKEGRSGFLGSAGEKRRRGRLCVRARVSSGAPGFCLSHNVTLEEEAGRASCTFLPPLRLSSSPPTPSSSFSASCRHLHNKSPQV